MTKKLVQKYPLLGSSVDPNSLSLTVKGVLMALIPVIIGVGSMAGVSIAEADLVQVIEAITTVVSGVMIIWGVVRKFIKK